MAFSVAMEEPQPSQLYIDAERMRTALDWFDFDTLAYDPIPVVHLDNALVITDGHTRAFLAYLGGANSIEMVEAPDEQALNTALYRACVEWCRAELVTQIADFTGRVVSRETFLEKWVTRCEQSPHNNGE